MKLILVGNGAWGRNYVSTLKAFPDVELQIANRNNWRQLIETRPQGVIVATPPDSHIEIASFAMDRQIPVMLEKPVALSEAEASKLKQYHHVPLLVNHIHLFSPAYLMLRNIACQEGVSAITSLGGNAGPIRNYSSLFDYGPHDVSMAMYLMGSDVTSVISEKITTHLWRAKFSYGDVDHVAIVGAGFSGKARTFGVVTKTGRDIMYDDCSQPNLYFGTIPMSVPNTPPLTIAIHTFIGAIEGKPDDRLGLDMSLRILSALERC